jgi:hypothetical protein
MAENRPIHRKTLGIFRRQPRRAPSHRRGLQPSTPWHLPSATTPSVKPPRTRSLQPSTPWHHPPATSPSSKPPRRRGLQPSTPRTRSRPRATATTLPERRPASRHALINMMSPEKQMDNNFQLMHDQQTYNSHRIMLLDEREP